MVFWYTRATMSKSIKIFFGIYLGGCIIALLAFISLVTFELGKGGMSGLVELVIMLFISGPLWLIGILGAFISTFIKHVKKEPLTPKDNTALRLIVFITLLIIFITVGIEYIDSL
jgi:hypothetical protein